MGAAFSGAKVAMPPLNLRAASTASTPRTSARSGGGSEALFALSARHLLKPEVGLSTSVSAMGDTPPLWNNGRPVLMPGSGANGKPQPVFHTCDGRMPYNVGRTRARGQLKLALTTEEETSQLRRLHEALDSNRFDRYLSRELGNAAMTARELSRRLGYDVTSIDLLAPQYDEVQQDGKPKKKKATLNISRLKGM